MKKEKKKNNENAGNSNNFSPEKKNPFRRWLYAIDKT